MKKNTKKIDPVFTINLSECSNERDLVLAFATAKYEAGLSLEKFEIKTIIVESFTLGMIIGRSPLQQFNEMILRNIEEMVKNHEKEEESKKTGFLKKIWNKIFK